MGDIYRQDELRFPQQYLATSAADAIFHNCSDLVTPANVARTIINMHYQTSVAEVRYLTFRVITAGAGSYNFRGPVSHDGNQGQFAVLEQGMELRLLPGDYIRFDRNGFTAGSTMSIAFRYIDHILPFQRHVDPYNIFRARSPFLRDTVSGPGGGYGGGGGFGGGEPGGGEGGGGGGGEPVL